MRVRTVRTMVVLILGAGSSALTLAQTKTAEKDAPVAALAPPETASTRGEGNVFWKGNQRSVSLAGGSKKSGGFVVDARAE